MLDAGVDEQLTMHRTSSAGVRSYKRITENLKEMASSVLNSTVFHRIRKLS
jgi:hypothetical protein